MSTTAYSGVRRASRTAAATRREPPRRSPKHRKADRAVTDYIVTRTIIMLTDAYRGELAKKCRATATEACQHWCEMNSLMQQGTTLRDSAIAALRAMWVSGFRLIMSSVLTTSFGSMGTSTTSGGHLAPCTSNSRLRTWIWTSSERGCGSKASRSITAIHKRRQERRTVARFQGGRCPGMSRWPHDSLGQ